MKKWHVEGRVRADIPIDEVVEAKTENAAAEIAEQRVYARCGISVCDVLDDEVYVEEILERDESAWVYPVTKPVGGQE